MVWIGGTSASATAWSNTAVTATGGASAVTGVAKIKQNGQWSNAVAFVVPSATQLTLSPNVMGLVVGETRAVRAVTAQGTPATGLAWFSSDTNVVTLSADDPPVLTAVGAGVAIIRAGDATADVTVYATSVPLGASRWSYGGNGSGVQSAHIAVPSYDGVADVFLAQGDGTIQAVRTDGTVGWQRSVPSNVTTTFVPDFQGGLVVATSQAIYRLNGLTGQPAPAFVATTQESQVWGLESPAIHPDGTIFTVDYACHDFCNGADATDGAWVVGVNSTTGAERFRVPLQNSTYVSQVNDAAFCQNSAPGFNTWNDHSFPMSGLRIAGDGSAYLSYVTFHSDGTLQRAATQPYTDAQYALWDQVVASTDASNFSAALAALDALAPAIGTTAHPPVGNLRLDLQNGNRESALGWISAMALWFPAALRHLRHGGLEVASPPRGERGRILRCRGATVVRGSQCCVLAGAGLG